MDKILYIFFVLGLIFLESCEGSDYAYVTENDSEFNLDSFYMTVPSWPYLEKEENVERLIQGYRNLSLGIEKELVRQLLGEPNVKNRTYNIKEESKNISSWLYISRMTGPLAEPDNVISGIVIYFDSNGKLMAATSNGIGALGAIGSMSKNDIGRYTQYW